jgi:hypothetical protein
MMPNVPADRHIPRIAMAVAAGVGAALAPTAWLKTGLFAAAAGLLTSLATGYCPMIATMNRGDEPEPRWRTLKTHRVEP